MADLIQYKTTAAQTLDAEGKTGENSLLARACVAVREDVYEGYADNQRLYQATNENSAAAGNLVGPTAFANTAPILIVRNSKGGSKIVIMDLTLWVASAPNAACQVIIALDTVNRYSSGGNLNDAEHWNLNPSGTISPNIEIYEALTGGGAIVATAGAGREIMAAYHAAAVGTSISLILPGSVILPSLNHSMLVYAWCGTTGPSYTYRLTWAER
jgi:hypothetical protein